MWCVREVCEGELEVKYHASDLFPQKLLQAINFTEGFGLI